jgi:DNA-binding transcriptional regulator YdaS (Cro superfamily)
LARALKITHPAIMGWKRVPAERALAIEAITGVPRTMLRPDIYPPGEYKKKRTAS